MQALAFVDLETTGTSITRDRITEIGVVLIDDSGVREWSHLINPQIRIPVFIEQLTGITTAMVAEAPTFAQMAEEILTLLAGRLLIAHNERFDYGFLKNEFRRLGQEFNPTVLCTVKLSRALYPQFRQHNLDTLIQRHGLQIEDRHRALADARLLQQFWHKLHQEHAAEHVQQHVKRLVQRSSLPSQLDPRLADEWPETAGIYILYGENDLPLYIGKSVNIRQRLLSHFAADHRSAKEMSLSQQVRRITWSETAGEWGALLLEARLIKQMMPVHNQRLRRRNALCAWRLEPDGDAGPNLVWADLLSDGLQPHLYGLYHNRRDAEKALRNLAEQHRLCQAILGLEKVARGRSCFAYQLKRCAGACVGQESLQDHAERLRQAMTRLRLDVWPYPEPVVLLEGTDWHLVDQWCYLGTAQDVDGIKTLLAQGRPAFDRDSYMLVRKALQYLPVSVCSQLFQAP